jgi:ribA/ribD-fused uncharacterized protein
MITFYDPAAANGYLANFAATPFILDGYVWPTVEHYYQFQKFRRHPRIAQLVRRAPSPADAKFLSRKFADFVDPEWASVREFVMYRAVDAKFSQSKALTDRLLATGNEEIVELAKDDAYWGSGAKGQGSNRMGVLLTAVREKLRRQARSA